MESINLKNINEKTGLKKSLLIFLIMLFVSANFSCKKYVEIQPPTNQVISTEVFSNDQTATAAVVGLYSQIMTSNLLFLNGSMSVYNGLSADEIYNVTTSTTYDPFYNNALVNSNATTYSLWHYAFTYIYQANACIAGLNASTGMSIGTKNQLLGEMKFTRAFCYFYLVNLFGDVPLETTTDYTANELLGRTNSSLVYTQIVTDLLDAQNLLNTAYPSTGTVRPNKYTATALLSRVYLYEQDWKDAVSSASAVIGSGDYTLVSNLNNVFLSGSTEAIWQLLPTNSTYNTAEGATFIPSSATVKPTFAMSPYLLNAFEAGDKRKTAWLNQNTVSGVVYTYPYKYKVRTGSTKTEYNVVLRLAEQYLIRAEADAQLGDITDAISDINMIRNRAGLALLPTALNQQSCLAAVAQENRIEFFAEWGHRWLDLKRTGQANNILGAEKANWKSTDALYPIPSKDILLNNSLTQNPGY